MESQGLRRALYACVVLAIGLSLGLAVVAALGDFPDVELRVRAAPLALSIVGMAVAMVCAAEVWRRVLRALGAEVPPLRGQAIWFMSNLGRYVPTSMLLPVLRVGLAAREGVPKRVCLASGVYEAALFLAANLFVGVYLLMELPGVEDKAIRFLFIPLPFLALAALHPRIFHPLADRLLARFGRDPLPVSLSAGRVVEFTALYVLVTALAGVSTYGLATTVYPVGADDLPVIAGAFAVGTVLSILAFLAPAGLVAREAGVALTVAQVMPAAPAVAFAVLSRILQLGVEIVLALVMPVVARRREAAGPPAARG
jgi:hypothetical protein